MEEWKDELTGRPICRGCGGIIDNIIDYVTIQGHGINWYLCDDCVKYYSPNIKYYE